MKTPLLSVIAVEKDDMQAVGWSASAGRYNDHRASFISVHVSWQTDVLDQQNLGQKFTAPWKLGKAQIHVGHGRSISPLDTNKRTTDTVCSSGQIWQEATNRWSFYVVLNRYRRIPYQWCDMWMTDPVVYQCYQVSAVNGLKYVRQDTKTAISVEWHWPNSDCSGGKSPKGLRKSVCRYIFYVSTYCRLRPKPS